MSNKFLPNPSSVKTVLALLGLLLFVFLYMGLYDQDWLSVGIWACITSVVIACLCGYNFIAQTRKEQAAAAKEAAKLKNQVWR